MFIDGLLECLSVVYWGVYRLFIEVFIGIFLGVYRWVIEVFICGLLGCLSVVY